MYDLRRVKAALQQQVETMMNKFSEMENQITSLQSKDTSHRGKLEEMLKSSEDRRIAAEAKLNDERSKN